MKNSILIKCPFCGEEFTQEHTNRKYCSEQCHNDYNNRIAKQKYAQRVLEQKYSKVIEQNDEILYKLFKVNKLVIDHEMMKSQGFDEVHCTTSSLTQSGRVIYYIKFKLLKISVNQYKIFEKDDNKFDTY